MTDKNFKSGFIAVVGRTNVGKSTLLNALIGQKIAIVSDKPQTTRNNIRLIRTTATSQMVFIDTPGFHRPKSMLGDYMVKSAGGAMRDVDLIMFLVEEDAQIGKGDAFLLETLAQAKAPVILVINKIDRIPKEQLLQKMELYRSYSFIKEIVPVSALKADNIDTLVSVIEKYLPEGPMYFPEDMVTDRAEKFIVQEIIREKTLRRLKDEIPHGVAVEVTAIKERPQGNIADVDATIYCEKKTHKAIIIGKDGAMLKRIGTAARYEIEDMLGIPINLSLWVKVRKDWRDHPFDLKELGYTEEK